MRFWTCFVLKAVKFATSATQIGILVVQFIPTAQFAAFFLVPATAVGAYVANRMEKVMSGQNGTSKQAEVESLMRLSLP